MRKTIFTLFIACFFISVQSYAQDSDFGIKAGLNLSNMTVDDNNDQTIRYGFHVGVFDKMPVSDYFSLQPELLYTTKGLKNNFDESLLADGEADFNLNYIEFPLKLVYNLSPDFEFQFGPYVSYLINANIDANAEVLDFFEIDADEDIDRENFNPFDFGLTGGLAFDLDPLVVGVNYNYGLTQVAKDDNLSEELLGDAKNTVIQIYAGLSF